MIKQGIRGALGSTGALCLALTLAACGSDSDDSGGAAGGIQSGGAGGVAGSGTGGAAGSGSGGAAGGSMGPEVTYAATINEFGGGGPVEGMEVCVMDTERCTMTDQNGEFVLEVPANSDVAITSTRDGYYPWISSFTTDGEDPPTGGLSVGTPAQADAVLGQVGIDQAPDKAIINVEVKGTGASASLSLPAEGPYFVEASGLTTLVTETPGEGVVGFGNVDPSAGVAVLTIEHATLTCSPGLGGWGGDAPNQVRVPVRAGFASGVARFNCE